MPSWPNALPFSGTDKVAKVSAALSWIGAQLSPSQRVIPDISNDGPFDTSHSLQLPHYAESIQVILDVLGFVTNRITVLNSK